VSCGHVSAAVNRSSAPEQLSDERPLFHEVVADTLSTALFMSLFGQTFRKPLLGPPETMDWFPRVSWTYQNECVAPTNCAF